ncbi:AAA family ATPase [Gemmatimonas sp.]|uniref:AAA family ATPase n=1 Tax=Gemmatimonas sp. TaxID=1962908 RepID=UPI003DA1D7E1
MWSTISSRHCWPAVMPVLVGVPGLAKTLLVQTVAQALDLTFSRVQVHARSHAE